MNKFISRVIILVLLCSIKIVCADAQVKTIVFDWKTKSFDSSFPFDEPFQVKLINLTSDIKSPLGLKIIKLDKKSMQSALDDQARDYPLRSYSSVLVDTNYYKKLKGEELSFVFKDTSATPSVEFNPLEPNQSYAIVISGNSVKKLSMEEKESLQSKLSKSEDFKRKIYDRIGSSNYYTLKSERLNDIMVDEVKNINDKYQLDLLAIDNKIADTVRAIGATFIKIEGTLKSFKNTLAKAIDTKELAKVDLSNSLGLLGEPAKSRAYLDRNNILTSIDLADDSLKKSLSRESYKKISKQIGQAKKNISISINKNQLLVSDLISTVMPESIASETIQFIGLNNTIPGTIEAKASIYISQSAGAGYSVRTGNVVSYLNYSFFFRPVNMEKSLDYYTGSDFWKVRLCLNVGFTFNNVSTNRNGTISGTLGDKAIVVGGGFRILSFLKLDVNNMLYYLDDPNPLIKHKRFNSSPVIGLSLNMNIAKLFAGQPNPLTDLTTLFK